MLRLLTILTTTGNSFLHCLVRVLVHTVVFSGKINHPSIIDLVTVTCARDFDQMILQSHSLDLFVKPLCNHWVFIEDSKIPKEIWYQSLKPYYTQHSLHLIQNTKSYPIAGFNSGWQRQQVIKLEAARYVQSRSYLCLDSKNFFINPTDLQHWPVLEGNNLVRSLLQKDPPFVMWMKNFCDQYDLKFNFSVCEPVTPFRMTTQVVKDLLDLDVAEIFAKNTGNISEFVLYSIFTQARGNWLANGPTPNYTFWNIEEVLTDNEEFFEQIAGMPLLKSMGVHRTVLKKLKSRPNVFFDWLASKGLDPTLVDNIVRSGQ